MSNSKSFLILGIAAMLVACGGTTAPELEANTSSAESNSSMASVAGAGSSDAVSSDLPNTSSSQQSISQDSSVSTMPVSASSVSSTSSQASDDDTCFFTLDTPPIPYCLAGDLSDPDENGQKDGWGWEQGRSCLVPSGLADNQPRDCAPVPPTPGGGNSPNHIIYNDKAIYLSGFNIAWLDFANDFGAGFDEARLRQALFDVSNAGGNSLRWWMHTDGSKSPGWEEINGTRLVTNPGGTAVDDLRKALDIAAEYDVYIVPALWSFDMLLNNSFRNPPTTDNYRLLSEDEVLQSYIDNALRPMVRELNKHPQLIAWELFNEPENMTEVWFRERQEYYGGPVPTKTQLQRTQAKMAAAIHREALANDEVALVTTGSKSMGKYNSDVAGGENWYRDDRMIAAADGDEYAILDFYGPHYYNNENKQGAWSPFHHNANHWDVDKPIVIGEFYVEDLDVLDDKVSAQDLCQRLSYNGYAGGWPWQWNEFPEALKTCIMNVE